MSNEPDTTTAKVVKMTPLSPKEKRKLEDKFSRQVVEGYGFTQLPNLLLLAQGRLKISPTEFNVLLHLIFHWWDADKWPIPKIETIARRMGKSERMVLRYLDDLEEAGLIQRVHRFKGKQKQVSSYYRLDGLRDKLIALEPEFNQRVSRQAAEICRGRGRRLTSFAT